MGKTSGWPMFVGQSHETLPDFVTDFPPDLAERENEKARPQPCREPLQPCIIDQSETPEPRREHDQRARVR